MTGQRSAYPGPPRFVVSEAFARRAELQETVRREPRNVAAWIELSQACLVVSDEQGAIDAAQAALDLDPEGVDAVRQYAYSLVQVGPRMVDSPPWFEKLLALAPNDPLGLHYRYNYLLLTGRYREAIETCERLDRIEINNPILSARMARAYRLQGNMEEARKHFAIAATRCSPENEPFPFGSRASLKPVYTALAGDPVGADALSRQMCQSDGTGLADLSHPRYPRDCAASIARLQARIRGRDLFVFGNGPSLGEVVSRRHEIAPLDFASMTMTSFQLANNDVLIPAGKQLDMVCMTQAVMVESQAEAIRDWMAAVPQATLVLPLSVADMAQAGGMASHLVHNQPDSVFWFDCYGEHLPTPQEPLHCPSHNTILSALFVAILGKPRRIFLFGFDGQIKGEDSQESGALYYKEHHESYFAPGRKRPEVRQLASQWLLWDSVIFNDIAPHVLRHVALLFDLPRPPIYNVCPNSAVKAFPRIDFDRFRELAFS